MNDDATSSSAANLPPSQDGVQPVRANSRSQSPARKTKAGLAKKLRFMTDLMTSLDMVVFAELCTLYYMDCSFFRLIIRATTQSFFLSPKSEDFLLLLPGHRPHVFAIFIPNTLCMLLHLFSSLPVASEASRGYLHGGVMIDFIGQKAPTSRIGLLLLDLTILAIQCLMLAVNAERERLRKIVLPQRRSPSTTSTSDDGATLSNTAPTTADHDAEERGVSRDEPHAADETNDIEMRPLSNREQGAASDEAGESSGLLDETRSRSAAAPDLGDVLRSGNAVLADFHVIQAIRTAGNDYQSAAAHSLQTIGYAATLARLAAERRARLDARNRPQ